MHIQIGHCGNMCTNHEINYGKKHTIYLSWKMHSIDRNQTACNRVGDFINNSVYPICSVVHFTVYCTRCRLCVLYISIYLNSMKPVKRKCIQYSRVSHVSFRMWVVKMGSSLCDFCYSNERHRAPFTNGLWSIYVYNVYLDLECFWEYYVCVVFIF